MGILDSVERGLERAVNGAFARTFRSGVQPVEIAAGLKRELDIGSVVVDRDRVLAPNRFVVRMAEADADRLTRMGGTLESELIGVVTKHARRQGYQLLGEPDVELQRDPSLTTGVLQIDATRVEGSVSWTPVLDVGGVRHALREGTTIIGRGSEADIRLSDTAASRQHLQVIWDGKAGIARDLGSTNGAKINGQRFREATLSPGTVITIGQTQLRFELVPTRHATRAPRPSTGADFSKAKAPRRPEASGEPTGSGGAAQNPIDQDFWRGL